MKDSNEDIYCGAELVRLMTTVGFDSRIGSGVVLLGKGSFWVSILMISILPNLNINDLM